MKKRKPLSPEHKESISKSLNTYWEDKRTNTINKSGYVLVSNSNKRYYQHRLIMEEYLGRKLRKDEHVHHKNGNKSDNRLENLELVNNREHIRLHAKNKGLGKDRVGIESTNKISKEKRKEIAKLREQGLLIREICELLKVSYPTALKYIKEEKDNGIQ